MPANASSEEYDIYTLEGTEIGELDIDNFLK